MEQELIDFLTYIYNVHTDPYGQLNICLKGDELDPTIERVVKDYLKDNLNVSNNVINNFISNKTAEYIGKHDFNQRIMVDWNGVNVITEGTDGNIIEVNCKENLN